VAEHEIGAVRGSADDARARLAERLVVVGDLWLPTRAEMGAWHDAAAPLYVRWTRPGGFEIGPRLETIPAARFAPVLRGRFAPGADGSTRLLARWRFPRSTRVVLATFATMVVAWGAVTLFRFATGDTHAGWVGAWAVTALITVAGPAAAWRFGRGELARELPGLRDLLAEERVPAEDW
jgi:hypothetical protein